MFTRLARVTDYKVYPKDSKKPLVTIGRWPLDQDFISDIPYSEFNNMMNEWYKGELQKRVEKSRKVNNV